MGVKGVLGGGGGGGGGGGAGALEYGWGKGDVGLDMGVKGGVRMGLKGLGVGRRGL